MTMLMVAFPNFVKASKNSERYDVLSFVPEEYVKAERMPMHDFILECCNKYLLCSPGPVFSPRGIVLDILTFHLFVM